MGITATASAVRSSVQADPSGPWSQSSQIWARHRGRALGEPQVASCFRYTAFLGAGSTTKRLWDMRRHCFNLVDFGPGSRRPTDMLR